MAGTAPGIAITLVQGEVTPSVFSPTFLIAVKANRPFFAIANGGQSGCRNPKIDQKRFDTFRSPITQCKVVFIGTAFITMPLDGNGDIGIFT